MAAVCQLCCNVDDMTAEEIGFAMDVLLENGALDVFTTAVGMKKNRPGTMITVLCRQENREKLVPLIFKHTTTIGIRQSIQERFTLDRTFETRETELGPVRVKKVSGYGVRREKAEYDDLARLARQHGKSIAEVRKLVK
jgi:hypothetical protein